MPELIHIDQRKWPDRLHWQLDAQRLGEDLHGTWLYAPASTIARRGHESPRRLAADIVMCVPARAWWIAEFYWEHPRHAVYVNIGTPPAWEGARVRQIDLDLDVVRAIDGAVEVLDEDEFLENRLQLAYPPDVVTQARTAADRVLDMLRRGVEPFGEASARWIELARRG